MKPFSGREMKAIEMLAALDSRLVQAGDAMRPRLKRIPNGWRQWRLITSSVERLLLQIYDTLPRKNLMYMHNLCQNGEVVIRFVPVTRAPEWMMILDEDLKLLLNAAMASECAVCLRDGPEVRRCPLRGALQRLAPAHDECATGCEYRNVAIRCELGRYV